MKVIILQGGKIIYNDFQIKPDLAFEKQKYNYKEDMLQIGYGDHYIIDVGWYPEFDSQGSFAIQVIKDFDWQNPLYKRNTKSLEDFVDKLNEAIQYTVDLKDKK